MRSTSVQTYAKTAGILFLLTMIAGFFGEFYVPTQLVVAHDATATANNIVEFNSMFRLGFAAYLIEAICDITLSLVMYVLLRPVHRNLALVAAFFGLVSTSVFAGAELFFFGSTLILGGANYLKSFSPDQLNTLALLSVKMYGLGAGIFMAFYGIDCPSRLPRFSVGLLTGMAGGDHDAASDFFLAPMFLSGLST